MPLRAVEHAPWVQHLISLGACKVGSTSATLLSLGTAFKLCHALGASSQQLAALKMAHSNLSVPAARACRDVSGEWWLGGVGTCG